MYAAQVDALELAVDEHIPRSGDVHGNTCFTRPDVEGAARNHTECRLAALAAELVGELSKRTIDYRQNYDGTQFEPIVIPARLPQLLMNGTTGKAASGIELVLI